MTIGIGSALLQPGLLAAYAAALGAQEQHFASSAPMLSYQFDRVLAGSGGVDSLHARKGLRELERLYEQNMPLIRMNDDLRFRHDLLQEVIQCARRTHQQEWLGRDLRNIIMVALLRRNFDSSLFALDLVLIVRELAAPSELDTHYQFAATTSRVMEDILNSIVNRREKIGLLRALEEKEHLLSEAERVMLRVGLKTTSTDSKPDPISS